MVRKVLTAGFAYCLLSFNVTIVQEKVSREEELKVQHSALICDRKPECSLEAAKNYAKQKCFKSCGVFLSRGDDRTEKIAPGNVEEFLKLEVEAKGDTSQDVYIVRDGQPGAVIMISSDANPADKQAGFEIIEHIKLISGVELKMINEEEDAGEMTQIRIGQVADASLDGLIQNESTASDAFALMVNEGEIDLKGLLPAGSQHAAFELLRQLGVRWHQPLEDGFIIPQKKSLIIKKQQTVSIPSEELRMMSPGTPRTTIYSLRMKKEHLKRVRRSPFVTPTLSGDENFVIGKSSGWKGNPDIFWQATHIPPITNQSGEWAVLPEIPPQELYGYRITDTDATNPKVVIVLTAGNHTEYTGCWSLHGLIEFLLSDDPRAVSLRQKAEFYVYPLLNPEGRYILSRVSNPAIIEAGQVNHNRLWNTAGIFETIDGFVSAIRYDTGGRARYVIDFHSNGTCIYTPPGLMQSDFIRAMSVLEPELPPKKFQMDGTTMTWGMSPDGLNAPYAFTPEHNPREPLTRCLEIGRSYGLALYDVLVVNVADRKADEMAETDDLPAKRDIPQSGGDLFQAVIQEDSTVVKRHLDSSRAVAERDNSGNTLLHIVSWSGSLEIAKMLLQRGAEVSARNKQDWTPLHYAARFGNDELAKILLENRANVNAVNRYGDTPLHLAVAYGHVKATVLLLKYGANPDSSGQRGLTPRQWATRLGYSEIIKVLDAK